MNIVALDLSLSHTGVAIGNRYGDTVHTWQPEHTGPARLRWFREQIRHLRDIDLVVIEGYAFGKGQGAHQLGELGGVVRLQLADLGIPYVELPPAVVKKLATGKGNAGKAEVLTSAVRRLGYEGHDDNEADALWLLEAALQHYGLSAVTLPAAHLAALAKIQWPTIGEAAA